MKKTEKTWLIIAVVLVAIGAILFTGAMTAYDWDFTQLSTVSYETNTHEPAGEFNRISIDVDTTKIELVPTEDQKCKIVCYESEKEKHTVSVQNGTLAIEMTDTRKWYEHIGISFGSPKMTVYLPQDKYTSLLIDADTGDVLIPDNFAFEDVEIKGDTSDVVYMASVSNVIKIESDTGNIKVDGISAEVINFSTDTGNININSVTSKGKINIETDTGEVNLSDVTCTDFIAESDTGTITLKNVVATGSLSVKSNTGDVRFKDSDAAQISVKTSTGDVTGTLLSEKFFMTETSTGKIRVPKTTSGGKCEIETSTGDIRIDIKL